MRTRQRIDPKLDPRTDYDDEGNYQKRRTEYLWKYVSVDQIELDKTHRSVQVLAEAGFDWVANVDRLLDDSIVLDIGSCFWDPTESIVTDGMTYGWTFQFANTAENHRSHISIGAELIWPLLSSDISSSEKLNCSFIIASVILHEMGVCAFPRYIFLP